MTEERQGNTVKSSWKERWKKIGMVGFLLFLLKGLVWLAVGYFILR